MIGPRIALNIPPMAAAIGATALIAAAPIPIKIALNLFANFLVAISIFNIVLLYRVSNCINALFSTAFIRAYILS